MTCPYDADCSPDCRRPSHDGPPAAPQREQEGIRRALERQAERERSERERRAS